MCLSTQLSEKWNTAFTSCPPGTNLHPVIQQAPLRPVLLAVVGETALYGAVVGQHGLELGQEGAAAVGGGRRHPGEQQRVGVAALQPGDHQLGRVVARQPTARAWHRRQLHHRPLCGQGEGWEVIGETGYRQAR